MKLEELIQTEIKSKPPRIVLYGVHGIGKTYFAACAPKPVFLLTEDGMSGLNKTDLETSNFPVAKDLDTFLSYMAALVNEENDYKTVVIDSLDWLEPLIWDKVCKNGGKACIEDFGYGKGYVGTLPHWAKIIAGLDVLRDQGKAIILLSHSEVKPFMSPDSADYDRYQPRLHKKACTIIEEWADAVLFLNYKTHVTEKGKGIGSGERTIYTEERPAWRAKNRYQLPAEIPFTIPFNFEKLMKGIKE